MKLREIITQTLRIARIEFKAMRKHPLTILILVTAPLCGYLILFTLMAEGLPEKLPAAIVDSDNSASSHQLVRTISALQYTRIVGHFPTFTEARKAMQRNNVYAIYYIPKGFEREVVTGRRPKLSFYINYAYLIAGSLLYKDLRTASELALANVGMTQFYAHGGETWQTEGVLQPIVIETHPVGNPWINYSIYLNNILFPGILMVAVLLVTVYAIGMEVKQRHIKRWLSMAKGNIYVALTGKLLPYTIIGMGMMCITNILLYGVLQYPCHCGIGSMIVVGVLFILAIQGLGVFIYSLVPWMRMAMSIASLWAVLSFPISGFTFPSIAMDESFQLLNNLFPLRHYYLIYANSALLGYPLQYVLSEIGTLFVFAILPIPFLPRLKRELKMSCYVE